MAADADEIARLQQRIAELERVRAAIQADANKAVEQHRMKALQLGELLTCSKAVLAIADRNHDAFNKLRKVIARIEGSDG